MTLTEAIKGAKRVYLCGNGGSAANAIHIANDLIGCGIRAHALTADVATLTAIANDHGYEHVFSQQLRVFADAGDLLICLSGSGNSPNIIEAIKVAKKMGMNTYAVTGEFTDALAADLAQHAIRVGDDMQMAEDNQLILGHKVMREMRG